MSGYEMIIYEGLFILDLNYGSGIFEQKVGTFKFASFSNNTHFSCTL